MLHIVSSRRRIREFVVYDFEWIPGTLEIRIAGVYDGTRYRCYRSVQSFLNGELTNRNRGKWFYAHAGGLADIQFVFEEFIGSGRIRVDASFSGSSAIIVHARQGKNAYHFIDSYWLFRDKLANIGRSLGLPKIEADGGDPDESGLTDAEIKKRVETNRRWYAEAPLSEIRDRNERDCEILWHAIDRFQCEILSLGGQLQMTIASTGMQLFKRRFLKAEIETDHYVNECARASYFSSRVEVFQRNVWNANYYDINSSFPYSMTFSCPGEFLGTTRRIPSMPGKLYLADCEIETPETSITTVPHRIGGRVFFPMGRWRNWLTNVDIELLLREGGKLHRVYEVLVFEPFEDLRDYVMTIYNLRKSTDDEFRRLVYKYLLNCLYGKFAESSYKQKMYIDPQHTEGLAMLMPGVWFEEKQVPIPHMHVPISTHVTALSRQWLYDYLTTCSSYHYCDTDGFSTEETMMESKELGLLKREKRIHESIFVASKLYHGKGEILEEGHWVPHTWNKGKGFSRLTTERFFRLLEGEAIEYERMARIRELYRSGSSHPIETLVQKRIKALDMNDSLFDTREHMLPKRFTYPDGTTRPWHLSELRSVLK